MKRVENVDVAEMVEAMGVVSNMIDEGNDAAFDVPCNEIATRSILVRSGSENDVTEFGGDVVKNDGKDVNLNVQNNENNVNVGGRTENANIPGVRFEKHDDESDCTDWIDSNHRKEINECKSLVIESELTISRVNEDYINNDKNKKAIPNQKSARDMEDDPKDRINGDKAPDGRAGNVSMGMGNIKGTRDEKMKYKYWHEFNFHDEKSWSDECLDCNEELVIKSEREKKGRLDIRNKANRLGDNGVKGKGMEVKIYDEFDEAIIKCMMSNHGDDKRKVNVSKTFKDNEMQRKMNKRKKHTKRLKNEHLPEI
ncbi:hypothetical protein F8M41_018138 [Gigaspora margarita]|uniref:Uncharacterized protein n=1 Tax=Gigaspora margarita TaxID=4874 RepID=A0A8H4ALZ9_GIGMA|nr:hypothetical protein F8M41_018138 [Gigaspora margarita]